jgi:NADH-quinone oxidoreductase subunit A
MTPLAAYLLLFVAVGIGFIFVHLMAGKIIRPNKPDPAKRTIYECGEPTIGSSWIQFDLRFYVVALLFVIFDVEVAFFFPWAVVFGKANSLAAIGEPNSAEDYRKTGELAWDLMPPSKRIEALAMDVNQLKQVKPEDLVRMKGLREKRRNGIELSTAENSELIQWDSWENRAVRSPPQEARSLAWLALAEIAVFFGVLLVGFAYLWHRGDLAWVRSLAAERTPAEPLPPSRVAAPLAKSAPSTVAEPVAHS